MKKFLSFAMLIASTTVFAQPYTETFNNLGLTGTSYSDGSFVGVENIEYSYVESRTGSTYPIDGEGIMLRRNDEPSRLTVTYPNGLSEFSFQYRKAHANTNPKALDILINGNLVNTTDVFGTIDGEEEDIYTYTLTNEQISQYNTNQENTPVTVTIRIAESLGNAAKKNRHVVIDNIVWAPYNSTLSVENNQIEGLKVYPNPATDVVTISSDANGTKKVAIFDMVGKKVLETETTSTVNVASLNKGIYILQIEENGKKASQKLVVK